MSNFDIHLFYMQQARQELSDLESRIGTLEKQIRSIRSALRSSMSGSSAGSEISAAGEKLNQKKKALSALATSLQDIIQSYQDTETEVIRRIDPTYEIRTERGVAGAAAAAIGTMPFARIMGGGAQFLKGSGNNSLTSLSAKVSNGSGLAGASRFSEDPVNLGTGNFIDSRDELIFGGGKAFYFGRYYNSRDDVSGSLGRNWVHNFEVHLTPGALDDGERDDSGITGSGGNEQTGALNGSRAGDQAEGSQKGNSRRTASVTLEDGRLVRFIQGNDKAWYAVDPTTALLHESEDSYVYTDEVHDRYVFDHTGRFLKCDNHDGTGFELHYDEKTGRLEQVTSCTGEYFSFQYDDAGFLRTVRDQAGRHFASFVEGGLLLRTVDPDDNTWTYGYDEKGRLISSKNPEGIVTLINEYDELDRVIRQQFADDSVMTYAYDDAEKTVTLTERNGSRIVYYHDGLGRIIRTVYPDSEESSTFNERGEKTSVTDRNGNTTRYGFDSWGNISSIITPAGQKAVLTYGAHSRPLTIKLNGRVRMRNRFDKNGSLISSEDALGRKVSFEYGEQGRLIRAVLPDGTEAALTYDRNGNVRTVSLPNGGIFTYTYDAASRVKSVTDPLGNETKFTWDGRGNILSETNAEGRSRTYTYDRCGHVTKIRDYDGSIQKRTYNAIGAPEILEDAEGRQTQLQYDSMWNVARVIRPSGAVTSLIYDENNRLSTFRDAEGGEISWQYDGEGNLTQEIDPEGAQTGYQYDADGHLTGIIQPDGAQLRFSYDADGNMVRADQEGMPSVMSEYDDAGQLLREYDTDGNEITYAYDLLGNVTSETDDLGRVKKYEYLPGTDLPSKITLPDGVYEEYEYDQAYNLIRYRDAAGNMLHYTYDRLGNVIRIDSDAWGSVTFTYDVLGNMTSRSDADGNVTSYTYTPSGNISSIKDALGNEAFYVYNEDGQLISVTQKGSPKEPERRTVYGRDLLGRITSILEADGRKTSYTYNHRGELLSHLDKEGNLTRYEYNSRGRMTGIQYADGRSVALSYDALQVLQEVRDWNGMTTIRNNSDGNPTSVIWPDGSTVRYTYGHSGERTSLTYPDGRTVKYTYDSLMRLSGIEVGDQQYHYSYDEFGRLSGKEFPGGLKTSYEYDRRSLLSSIINSDREGVLDRYDFQYDKRCNKSVIERFRRDLPDESGRYELEYDLLNRLTGISRNGSPLRRYQYDAFSNRTEKVDYSSGKPQTTHYTYNAFNQLLTETIEGAEPGSREYRYDGRGNLSEILAGGRTLHRYEYDAVNQLSRASDDRGRIAEYYYNGLNRRIGRKVTLPDGSTQNASYILDLTLPYNNLLQMTEGAERQSFLYDSGVIGFWDAQSPQDSSLYRTVLSDDIMSPARLYDPAGSLLESYRYDEFGNTKARGSGTAIDAANRTGSASGKLPFRFNGYIPDPVADTYYVQAREYLPTLGIFAAHDLVMPETYLPQEYNCYRYANNDPASYTDLNGEFAAALFAIGAVVGAATSAAGNAVAQEIKIRRGEQSDFDRGELFSSILGGAAKGAVTGAITAVAPGMGVVAKAATAAGGGFAGKFVEDITSDQFHGRNVNWGKAATDGAINGVVTGAFSLMTSGIESLSPVKKLKKGLDDFKASRREHYFGSKDSTKDLWEKMGKADKAKKFFNKLPIPIKFAANLAEKTSKKLFGQLIRVKADESAWEIVKSTIGSALGFTSLKKMTVEMIKNWGDQDPNNDNPLVVLRNHWEEFKKGTKQTVCDVSKVLIIT